MVSTFPYRPEVDHRERAQIRVSPADAEQAAALQALGSETARTLLSALQAEPATASDLAGTVDTSLQNVQYHLDQLCEAGLVEPVDTWYSARGRSMTVYAATAERLVVEFDDPSVTVTESAEID